MEVNRGNSSCGDGGGVILGLQILLSLLWTLSNFPTAFSEQIRISDNVLMQHTLPRSTHKEIKSLLPFHHFSSFINKIKFLCLSSPSYNRNFPVFTSSLIVVLHNKPFKISSADITKNSSPSRMNFITKVSNLLPGSFVAPVWVTPSIFLRMEISIYSSNQQIWPAQPMVVAICMPFVQ